MVNPISSNNTPVNKTVAADLTPAKASAQTQSAQVKAPVQTPKAEDVVQLSYSAQAQALRQKGMSIPQIALQLRLDVRTVTSFFPQST
jgi:hypothetical protein